MTLDVADCRPHLRIDCQQYHYQVFALHRDHVLLRELVGASNDGFCSGCSGRLGERKTAEYHAVQHHSTGPHIDSCTIVFLPPAQHLRSHVSQGTHIDVRIHCISDARNTEISNFHS